MSSSVRSQSVTRRRRRSYFLCLLVVAFGIVGFVSLQWWQGRGEFQLEQPVVEQIRAAGGQVRFTIVRNAGPFSLPLQIFSRVHEVRFDEVQVPEDVFSALESLHHLKSVIFHNSHVGETRFGDQNLKRLERLVQLQAVHLVLSDVTDEGLKSLPHLTHLESLALSSTKVTDAGLKHLSGLKNLSRLQLARLPISNEGLSTLVPLQNLSLLDLNETHVTDEGLKFLESFLKLESLDLGSTAVSDGGLPYLGALPKLLSVILIRTNVSDVGLDQLKSIGNLRYLRVEMTQTTAQGRASLRAAISKCDITPNP